MTRTSLVALHNCRLASSAMQRTAQVLCGNGETIRSSALLSLGWRSELPRLARYASRGSD